MAITADTKGVKVVLNLAKGSQTISGLSKSASDEGIYGVATAVAPLIGSDLEMVVKVEETNLIEE